MISPRTHRKLLLHGVAAVAGLAVVCIFYVFLQTEMELKEQIIEEQEREKRLLVPKLYELQLIEKATMRLEKDMAFLDYLRPEKFYSSRWVAEIFNLFPKQKATMTKFQQHADTVLVEGYMKDIQRISKFVQQLEQSPFFRSVRLLYAKQGKKDNYVVFNFSINLQLQYVEERNEE